MAIARMRSHSLVSKNFILIRESSDMGEHEISILNGFLFLQSFNACNIIGKAAVAECHF